MREIWAIEGEDNTGVWVINHSGESIMLIYNIEDKMRNEGIPLADEVKKTQGLGYKICHYVCMDKERGKVKGEWYDKDYYETKQAKNSLAQYWAQQERMKVENCGRLEMIVPGMRQGMKILEIGCAYGQNVDLLQRQGYDAYGVDISRYSIEKGGFKNCYCADASEMGFNHFIRALTGVEFFDLIFSNITIEHIYAERIPAFLKNLYDITTVGGHHLHGIDLDYDESSHYSMMSRQQWRELFRIAGFKELEASMDMLVKNYFLFKKET